MIATILAGYNKKRAYKKLDILKESVPKLVKSLDSLVDYIIVYTNPLLRTSLESKLGSIKNLSFNTDYYRFGDKLIHIFNLAEHNKVLITTGDLYNAYYPESKDAIQQFLIDSTKYHVTIGYTPYWRLEHIAPEILFKKPSKSPIPVVIHNKKRLVKEVNLVFLNLKNLKNHNITWIGQSLDILHSKKSLLGLNNVLYWIRVFTALTRNASSKQIQHKLSCYTTAYLLTSFVFKSFYKTFRGFSKAFTEPLKNLMIPNANYITADSWSKLLQSGYDLKASLVVLDNLGGALLALDADSNQQLAFYKNKLSKRLGYLRN